jgi:hypothetical protein
MDDKSCANWAKINADLKKRKADILKAYEEKRMADRKADQERWKAERKAYEEKIMAEQKADQKTREAERKAYEEKGMTERKVTKKKERLKGKPTKMTCRKL